MGRWEAKRNSIPRTHAVTGSWRRHAHSPSSRCGRVGLRAWLSTSPTPSLVPEVDVPAVRLGLLAAAARRGLPHQDAERYLDGLLTPPLADRASGRPRSLAPAAVAEEVRGGCARLWAIGLNGMRAVIF